MKNMDDREEDLKAFEHAMREVAPLGQRSRSDRASSSPAHQAPGAQKIMPEHPLSVPAAKPVDGRDILDWRRPGLRDRDYHNLRRGRLSPPPETVDLHGQNAQEACDIIATAIARAQQMNRLSVCLIHGKGQHSEGRGARLKGLVDAVLRRHPEVLGFHSVPGNTGAVNILLRRARR